MVAQRAYPHQNSKKKEPYMTATFELGSEGHGGINLCSILNKAPVAAVSIQPANNAISFQPAPAAASIQPTPLTDQLSLIGVINAPSPLLEPRQVQ